MPITPFLRGQAFDPETIEVMSEAFTQACRDIGLNDRSDKMTEIVARQVIELAQRGVHTKTALYLLTVQQFKNNPQ